MIKISSSHLREFKNAILSGNKSQLLSAHTDLINHIRTYSLYKATSGKEMMKRVGQRGNRIEKVLSKYKEDFDTANSKPNLLRLGK